MEEETSSYMARPAAKYIKYCINLKLSAMQRYVLRGKLGKFPRSDIVIHIIARTTE